MLRLSGKGGDPVVELQTNFGGGKTHSILALYHLFSGVDPADLPGADELVKELTLPKNVAGLSSSALKSRPAIRIPSRTAQ